MGVGLRTFMLDGDGRLRRISARRYEAFWDGEELLPDHAGGEVRLVIVYLETKDRRPTRAFRVECLRYRVRPDGRLDKAAVIEHAVTALALHTTPKKHGNVIDAAHAFLRRQHRRETEWDPSEEQFREIGRMIFGS